MGYMKGAIEKSWKHKQKQLQWNKYMFKFTFVQKKAFSTKQTKSASEELNNRILDLTLSPTLQAKVGVEEKLLAL